MLAVSNFFFLFREIRIAFQMLDPSFTKMDVEKRGFLTFEDFAKAMKVGSHFFGGKIPGFFPGTQPETEETARCSTNQGSLHLGLREKNESVAPEIQMDTSKNGPASKLRTNKIETSFFSEVVYRADFDAFLKVSFGPNSKPEFFSSEKFTP